MSEFTIEFERWYAWTMFPGYAEQPYMSPIFVNAVEPRGNRRLRHQYVNAGDAAGVQNIGKLVESIRRAAAYLACRELEPIIVGSVDRPDALESSPAPTITSHS